MFFANRVQGEPVGWESTRRIDLGSYSPDNYAITYHAGLAVIVFECVHESRRELYAAVSYDRGARFFPPVKIAENSETDVLLYPRVAIDDDGRILVVWQQLNRDELKYRIYYSFSDNRGASFLYPRFITSESEMDVLAQPLLYNGMFHVFFHSYEDNKFTLRMSRYSGEIFDGISRIDTGDIDLRGAFFPAISIVAGKLIIVWQGKRNNQLLTDDLFCSSSADGGKIWTVPVPVTETAHDESTPVLLYCHDTLYCVYQSNEGGNWKISLSRSDSDGALWEKGVTVYNTNTSCYLPALACGNDGLMIFWQDTRDKISRVSVSSYSFQTAAFSQPGFMSGMSQGAGQSSVLKIEGRLNCYWLESGSVYCKRDDAYAPVPAVSSPTHPSGQWSNFSNAEMFWQPQNDESGIAGYATIVNKERLFNPTVQNREAHENYERISLLPDGISYFHIRSIDKAGNYSRTVHYPLMVSAELLETPEISSSTHKDGKASIDRSAEFSWTVQKTDRLKGFYYSLSVNSVSVPDKFTEKNEVDFTKLAKGRYFFSVRAVDKAGKPGRIGTFELLIGEEGSFGAVDYEKIAQSIADDTAAPGSGNVAGAGSVSPLLRENVDVAEMAVGTISVNSTVEDDKLRLDFVLNGENTKLKTVIYSIEELGIQDTATNGNSAEIQGLHEGEYTVRARALYIDTVSGLEYESGPVLAIVQVYANDTASRFIRVFESMYMDKWRLVSSLVFSFLGAFLSMPLLLRLYFFLRTSINALSARTKLFF